MSIKGIWVVPRQLASGVTRYHYYTDRNGGPRFWSCDGARCDLPGMKLSPDFIAAYERARDADRKPGRGSFASAIGLYRAKSTAFKKMAPKSRTARIKYLDAWQLMPMKNKKLAALAPLSVFDHRGVIKYITAHRDATWGHSPSTADEAMFALSAFLKWCKQDGRLDWNRAQNIPSVYERPTEARIWTPQEQAAFLADAPWQVAAAFKLAIYTGLRHGDLCSLPITAIKDEHIIIPTGKSRGQNTALVPIIPPLRALIDELNERRKGFDVTPMTVLFSSRGTPWASGFKGVFYRHRATCDLGDNPPSIHDLRKTAVTNMVILQKRYEAITDTVLGDMFAWASPGTIEKMKRIYVSDAAVIAAMMGKG